MYIHKCSKLLEGFQIKPSNFLILTMYLSVFISRCAVIPQTADIPLIKEKGDLCIDAGVSILPTANETVS